MKDEIPGKTDEFTEWLREELEVIWHEPPFGIVHQEIERRLDREEQERIEQLHDVLERVAIFLREHLDPPEQPEHSDPWDDERR